MNINTQIIHFSPYLFEKSGILTYFQTVKKYSDKKHKIFSPIMLNNKLKILLRNKVIIYFIETLVNTLYLFSKHFKSNQNMIYHIHQVSTTYPLIVSRILNIKCIWHLHETNFNYQSNLLYRFGGLFINNNLSTKVFVSKKSRESFRSDGKVIYHPVDYNYWENKRDYSNNRIICVANYNQLKGYDILIEALIINQFPYNLEFSFYGIKLVTQRKYIKRLSDLKEKLPNNIVVNLNDSVDKIQLRKIYSEASFFILPSRTESLPFALLESVASGCVSIFTDVGDLKTIFGEEYPLLIKDSSPTNILDVIHKAISFDIIDRKKIASNSKKILKEKISIERFKEDLNTLYNGIISL